MLEAKTPVPFMRAVAQPAYGTAAVLELVDRARPSPGAGQVLVRVEAAAVCKGDVHLLTGKPYLVRLIFGVRRPSYGLAGQEIAGRVEAVGAGVTAFRIGDEVFGQVNGGGFAEYAVAPVDRLAKKPRNLSFVEAAALPDSAVTALQALRDVGKLSPGQRVLVNGASGGVGSYAVQIAQALGAQVTAVCSTRHVAMVRGLGASRVIDYTQEDFVRTAGEHDLVLDLVGNRALSDLCALVKKGGLYISCAGSAGGDWLGPLVWVGKVLTANVLSRPRAVLHLVKPNATDFGVLREMCEDGRIRPVIEHTFPLSRAAEAVAHVAEGHAQGKTVIVMRDA